MSLIRETKVNTRIKDIFLTKKWKIGNKIEDKTDEKEIKNCLIYFYLSNKYIQLCVSNKKIKSKK